MEKAPARFLWGILIWQAIVLFPLAFTYFSSGRHFRTDDLKVVAPIVLVGFVVVSACSLIAPKLGSAAAVLLGIVCGAAVLAFGGFAMARLVGGFETSAATFSGSLALAIPSGVAGGIVGWLNRRTS